MIGNGNVANAALRSALLAANVWGHARRSGVSSVPPEVPTIDELPALLGAAGRAGIDGGRLLRARKTVAATLARAGFEDEAIDPVLPAPLRGKVVRERYFGTLCGVNAPQAEADRIEAGEEGDVALRFDPGSRITTGTYEGFSCRIPGDAQVERFFTDAHPLNWKKGGGKFFKESRHVHWDGRAYVPYHDEAASRAAWARERGGAIREIVAWDVNPTLPFEVNNILEIFDFAESRAKGERSLSYGYKLVRTEKGLFGVAWEDGGLEVDDGTFEARARRDGGRWELSFRIVKKVRYAMLRNVPSSVSAVLNLTTPALLSMFLSRIGPEAIARLEAPRPLVEASS
jgi:hypothetical protein